MKCGVETKGKRSRGSSVVIFWSQDCGAHIRSVLSRFVYILVCWNIVFSMFRPGCGYNYDTHSCEPRNSHLWSQSITRDRSDRDTDRSFFYAALIFFDPYSNLLLSIYRSFNQPQQTSALLMTAIKPDVSRCSADWLSCRSWMVARLKIRSNLARLLSSIPKYLFFQQHKQLPPWNLCSEICLSYPYCG